MRFILLTLLTILGFEMSPASAQLTTQFPFCIQGVDNPGWSGCSFSTFQECQATASGTESECLSNPWYKSGSNGASPSSGMQSITPSTRAIDFSAVRPQHICDGLPTIAEEMRDEWHFRKR